MTSTIVNTNKIYVCSKIASYLHPKLTAHDNRHVNHVKRYKSRVIRHFPIHENKYWQFTATIIVPLIIHEKNSKKSLGV